MAFGTVYPLGGWIQYYNGNVITFFNWKAVAQTGGFPGGGHAWDLHSVRGDAWNRQSCGGYVFAASGPFVQASNSNSLLTSNSGIATLPNGLCLKYRTVSYHTWTEQGVNTSILGHEGVG